MSRVFVGFLAACVAAAATVLFGPQPAAQPQPTTTAIERSVATEVAQSVDEAAFEIILVNGSPWHVTWERIDKSGTHNITFTMAADGTINGTFSNSSSGSPDAPMKDVTLRLEDGTCVRFTSQNDNVYTYCLNPNGVLEGTQVRQNWDGSFREGTAIAKPAGRPSPGGTVLHAPTKDAIHIGDNAGYMDDIRHLKKTFVGDKFRIEFLLKQVPMEAMNLRLTAGSVSASGRFICESRIYVNDQNIGLIENGERSYDVDPAILEVGANILTLVSQICTREDGSYASGLDDIVIKEIKISTK